MVPTILLTGGFGLSVGKVGELHLPVDPREVAIPKTQRREREGEHRSTKVSCLSPVYSCLRQLVVQPNDVCGSF